MSELEEACVNMGIGCTARHCNMLADMSFHSLDLKKAGFWSAKALEIQPDSVTALHHAALVAWNLKESQAAMEMVRKCLVIQPRSSRGNGFVNPDGFTRSGKAQARDKGQNRATSKEKGNNLCWRPHTFRQGNRSPNAPFVGGSLGQAGSWKKSCPALVLIKTGKIPTSTFTSSDHRPRILMNAL